MTTTTKITGQYKTLYTRGYTGSVARDQNRAAHGGVCHTQIRRTPAGKVLARKVNSNGRYIEIGEAWEPTADELARMLAMAE